MKILAFFVTLIVEVGADTLADAGRKHLFILSGQSNMVGMDPAVSFSPAVKRAFGKENVIVVKKASSGQSIRSWAKSNHEDPPPTRGRVPKVRGELYDPLIKKVKESIEGKNLKTVTLVWMQGESDLNNTAYEAYLNELLGQLEKDLEFKVINIVIGRISDSGLDNPKRLEGRLNIRKVQKEFAEAHCQGAWVNTDDLNDRFVDGQKVNDLHYTKEGYRILGERFAQKAISLIESKKIVANGSPKWGFLGNEDDVRKLFLASKNVLLICIVDTELKFDTSFSKLNPPFGQVVHHATVVSSYRGVCKTGEKIRIGFVTDSLPKDEKEREAFVSKANKKAKGVLKFAFLGSGKDGIYSCEWLDLADYSPELGALLGQQFNKEQNSK